MREFPLYDGLFSKIYVANIIKCQMLKAQALRPGKSRGCFLPLILFDFVSEILASAYDKKKNKNI